MAYFEAWKRIMKIWERFILIKDFSGAAWHRSSKTSDRDPRLNGHWTTYELWFGLITFFVIFLMAVMWWVTVHQISFQYHIFTSSPCCLKPKVTELDKYSDNDIEQLIRNELRTIAKLNESHYGVWIFKIKTRSQVSWSGDEEAKWCRTWEERLPCLNPKKANSCWLLTYTRIIKS